MNSLLLLTVLLNPLLALFHLAGAAIFAEMLPNLPAWRIPVVSLLVTINSGLAIGIWKWQRWAVHGFVVVSLIALIISLASELGMLALWILLNVIVMLALVRVIWSQMD
ncbi:MAG: hypothetical protein HC837_00905 [Chloroflexaceae bacterium]|nr:hypothetical protein [Chloroflexaceae bacterium]